MYFLRESVLVYTPSPDISAPTVITVPATWQYPDTGYDVTLAPAELATWAPGNGRIKMYSFPGPEAECCHQI
jgi:hypothetical protein